MLWGHVFLSHRGFVFGFELGCWIVVGLAPGFLKANVHCFRVFQGYILLFWDSCVPLAPCPSITVGLNSQPSMVPLRIATLSSNPFLSKKDTLCPFWVSLSPFTGILTIIYLSAGVVNLSGCLSICTNKIRRSKGHKKCPFVPWFFLLLNRFSTMTTFTTFLSFKPSFLSMWYTSLCLL